MTKELIYLAQALLCTYCKEQKLPSSNFIYRLRGAMPFDGDNEKEVLKSVFKDEVPINDEHWQNISSEGKISK